MKTKRINFFATIYDLREVFAEAEKKKQLFAFRAGPHDSNEATSAPSIHQLVLSDAHCPAASVHAPYYLVWDRQTEIHYRPHKTVNDHTKYIVDPIAHPDGIMLRPGGLYDATTLIAGELAITSDELIAAKLFTLIKNIILRKFQRVRSYYVGEEAMRILTNGGRLTADTKAPKEYDLSKP